MSERTTGAVYAPSLYPTRRSRVPVSKLTTRLKMPMLKGGVIVALLILAFYGGKALAGDGRSPEPPVQARGGHVSPHPIARPVGLLAAKKQCPNDGTLVECRAALRRALSAVAWAKRERAHRWSPTVELAIQLACTSQPSLDCNWFRRMIGCESGRDPFSKNRSSTASGLAQFLDGTWSGNPYHRFSVFNPLANALGAAWLAVRNGRGPWYASRGCWS